MSKHPLVQMFEMAQNQDDEDKPKKDRDEDYPIDIQAIRLRESYDAFMTRHVMRPGMIVRQKTVATAYRNAGRNDLCIVMELIDPPLVFESVEGDLGSPYFRKMIIGQRQGTSFGTFHVDSRHYEPVPESELRLRTRGTDTEQ